METRAWRPSEILNLCTRLPASHASQMQPPPYATAHNGTPGAPLVFMVS